MPEMQEDDVCFPRLRTELSTIMVDIPVARMHCQLSMEGAGGVRVTAARSGGRRLTSLNRSRRYRERPQGAEKGPAPGIRQRVRVLAVA